MKNYIKNLIVGILSFVVLFSAQGVFAGSTIWNNSPDDCPDINIANYTTNNGYGSPCWTGTNINANPGDVINVKVYYHNTSKVTATNTSLKLFAPTDSSTNHSFSAQILSSQGNLYTSTVKVNIPSSQTITILSTKWYPNQSLTPVSLLNGQSSSAVLSSNGLSIGSIAPGWDTQGTINVAFKVSSNSVTPKLCQDRSATNYGGSLPCVYPTRTRATCVINSFSANPTSITSGSSSTLSWSTSNCTSVRISPSIGSINNSGSQTISPTSTTKYTLIAYDATRATKTQDVTVTVSANIPSVMTGNITPSISSCSITSGNSSCVVPFSWATQNPEATSSVTHNGNTIANGNNGSQSFSVAYGSQTYYLYNNSKLLDSETVSANCASGTSWNGSYCSTNIVNTCIINNFSASPTSITSGDSSTLSWSTSNCNNVTISNLGYGLYNSGSQTVYPTSTTTYLLTAYGLNGTTQTSSVKVLVNQQSTCSINNFYASPTSIERGDVSILTWDTSNCTSVAVTNLGYGLSTSGSQAVYPTSTKSYTLTAYNMNGYSQSRTITVYVDDYDYDECTIDSFTASDTDIDEGDSITLKWKTTNCNDVRISHVGDVDDDGSEKVYPDRDTTYVLTAYDSNNRSETRSLKIYVDEDNDDNNNDDYCYVNSFTANKIYINSGDAVTLRWNTTDCDDVSISGIGDVDDDGSETVYPTSTRTYTLRATGDNTQSRYITINVNYYNPVIPVVPVYNVDVVTTVATNISQTGAQLNGLITNSNYNNANVYFEYGTTVNLGLRTNSRTTNGSTNFSEYVTGLNPNTIYFFQAVSEGADGISRGAIQIFKTLAYSNPANPVKPVIIQGPTVTSSASPIVLRIENKYQMIGIGDVVDYTVYYKNISSSKLTNPMVQVFVPEGITLLNISRGTYSESDRTLSVPIEDLDKNEEGVIYLQGRVDDIDKNLAQIVTTVILVYTNPNGSQENAMAYVLNNPKDINLLGASAFFGGMFDMSLIEWLLVIIFIMLLVLIAKSLYGHRSTTTTTTEHTVSH